MRHLFDSTSGAAAPSPAKASLLSRAQKVAEIAASEAISVDQKGEFPYAAIMAAKQNKLLSALVPGDLGGEGAPYSDIAEVCFVVAQSCASAGMILAMHYVALACLVTHGRTTAWHKSLLQKVAREELLFASSTTEGTSGGNVRTSSAPLVRSDKKITLERAATVMSYGAQADGIVTTARRDTDSAASDQSLVVLMKDDYELRQTSQWETLGMRGTCSSGFALHASASSEQVLPVPYKTIHAQTMVPVSHLLWSSAWIGIAAAAVARARSFARSATRRSDAQMPPGIGQYPKALAALEGLRAQLCSALSEFERLHISPETLETIETQTKLTLLKVTVSEGALSVVSMAMRACGLAGYREDGEFSIARHLRDILSAPIMIHNERILMNVASSAILAPIATSLYTP